jgi:anti-anti-sigma regulatory factor
VPDEEPLGLTTVAFARETAAKGPGYRIKARGDIDAATAPTFVAALDAVLEQGATLVVLDASEIEKYRS